MITPSNQLQIQQSLVKPELEFLMWFTKYELTQSGSQIVGFNGAIFSDPSRSDGHHEPATDQISFAFNNQCSGKGDAPPFFSARRYPCGSHVC